MQASKLPADFGVLILTHGRPHNVLTVATLRAQGYTGPVVIVIDDEDPARAEYEKQFEDVAVFSKADFAASFDMCDNEPSQNGVVYARNAAYNIAKERGFQTFLQLDDDYTQFRWKRGKRQEPLSKLRLIKNLDRVFSILVAWYRSAPIDVLAMAQGGDFLGGAGSGTFRYSIMRKAMNSMFCSADRQIEFMGRINEDTNAYVKGGNLGRMYITLVAVGLEQIRTQAQDGGMTDLYRNGTYRKSMYTVLLAPSCTSVRYMKSRNGRLHHAIDWDLAVPKIVPARFRRT